MAYVPVPKDLTKVKTKVAFNLTKGSLSASAAVPDRRTAFLMLRGPVYSVAGCMMLVMLALLHAGDAIGTVFSPGKDRGQIIKVAVIRPKERPYQTKTSMPFWNGRKNLKEVLTLAGQQKLAFGTAKNSTKTAHC